MDEYGVTQETKEKWMANYIAERKEIRKWTWIGGIVVVASTLALLIAVLVRL
jgi:hypothetical protein